MAFYIFHRHRVCLVDCVDLICTFTAGGKVLGLLPYSHCPWVSIVALFPPLHVGCPLGFAPEAALEDLGLPLRGPGVEVVQLLGSQGFSAPGIQGSWRIGQQEIWCSRRGWQPVLANMLQYSCLEKPPP